MTVLLDDHLLRDWMVGPDAALAGEIDDEDVMTTNLWYARLCKSAARRGSGALLSGWPETARRALVAGLVALPDAVAVVPIRDLAWEMGVLAADHRGLSMLGAEAVAAARSVGARVLVSARDDGPGIRACCTALGIGYDALAR